MAKNQPMNEHRSTVQKSLSAYRTVLAVVLLCCVGLLAYAANPANLASVTLAWNASPDDYRTNNVFYCVYAGTNAALATDITKALTNAPAGTNLSVVMTNLAAGQWVFVATAKSGGLESGPSNPAYYTIRSTPPSPPAQLATVFLDASINMTNWTDLGFFRVRIVQP